ncbi:MAG: hypothetical protein HQM13_09515 [SAR324 cluster bacterium]|nr:hypothetical protein [SAR324 cluster bacterium]
MRKQIRPTAALVFCGLQLILGGCSSNTESMFFNCKLEIDENRQKVRKMGHYSYSYDSYSNCMRPFYLMRDLEEWKPSETPANP